MNYNEFVYDVFVGYSPRDIEVANVIARQLSEAGLRVCFDRWVGTEEDDHRASVEDALEHSRVLLLCMSDNAFRYDWPMLESRTFRFRDPLNAERRLILLRLDEAQIPPSLKNHPYIAWHSGDETRFAVLLRAIQERLVPHSSGGSDESERFLLRACSLNNGSGQDSFLTYAFSPDGRCVLTGPSDDDSGGDLNGEPSSTLLENKAIHMWNVATGRHLRALTGHSRGVNSLAVSADQRRAISASFDATIRLWDLGTGECLRVLEGHEGFVYDVAWSSDERLVASCAEDATVRVWDVETGRCVKVLKGHSENVYCAAWIRGMRSVVSGGVDGTVRLWDLQSGQCVRKFDGHAGWVFTVAASTDDRWLLSAGKDRTIRLWDVETGRCVRVLEGHTDDIWSVVWAAGSKRAVSGSSDGTIRVWDVEKGRCLRVLGGQQPPVYKLALSSDERVIYSGNAVGEVRVWDFVAARSKRLRASSPANEIQYTNAKVLLVGESGAGKTGLSMRLALNKWQPSDSTVGAWATQWKFPVQSGDGVEREIWLWDFGGQADQRLIHQLYMDETALAVLVFDSQKDDLFETLGQWDRALIRASSRSIAKLLVAGRVDAGRLRDASRGQLEAFARERGYLGVLETSAKTGEHCDTLRNLILDGIRWDDIPCRTTLLLFKRLKEEIVALKDANRVLMRFNELRETLQLRLLPSGMSFTDEQLAAVVTLLSGPGVVWELKFGSWVLLQPETINAYAQAVIQTLRSDEHERGCLLEERVLTGQLAYHSSMERLQPDEERFILLAMHQALIERGICLRETTDSGTLLIFPSYYRRERPEITGHPAVLVSYRFNGFLDDIYATLVVRLHHTKSFKQDHLWRYAADFQTLTGKQLGVKLNRLGEGSGELEVYFEPAVSQEEKIIFSKYVHEHLLHKASNVVRLRHYVCPHCGTPAGNREVAMKKLREGKKDIPCVNCDSPSKRIPLWDSLEASFGSSEMNQRVRELEEKSAQLLDAESKERALVGDVISTVALAGQIARELTVSDHGIDMEIEFKSDQGTATGRKVYLQLKSGDSYLKARKSDGAEIFRFDKGRHATYWADQRFPVVLLIRSSDGNIRWMEVRDHLQRLLENGQKRVTQIVFTGERFDVMTVRQWRDEALFAAGD